MTTLVVVLSILSGVLAALLVMKFKSQQVVMPTMEEKAQQEAESMTKKEKEDALRTFTGTQTRELIKGINFTVTGLNVRSVSVFGKKYRTLQEAAAYVSSNKVRHMMLVADAELALLRKEKAIPSKPYQVESTVFYGDVFKYNECMVGIETTTGANANKPARLAVKIEKDDDGEMGITEVYVSAGDIAASNSVTRFNMQLEAEFNKFESLIATNSDYADEMNVIETLYRRLEKYNYLITEGLLTFEGDKFVFVSPTAEQLDKVKDIDGDADPKHNPNVINIFDYMHSSQE